MLPDQTDCSARGFCTDSAKPRDGNNIFRIFDAGIDASTVSPLPLHKFLSADDAEGWFRAYNNVAQIQ